MVHRALSRVAAALRSRAFMAGAVALLAIGAVSGTGGLVIAQRHQERDKVDLKGQIADLKSDNENLQGQLDKSKGEQECRAQVAADSELLSGQVLVGLSNLVTSAFGEPRDTDGARAAIRFLAATSGPLLAALQARQESVSTCSTKEAP